MQKGLWGLVTGDAIKPEIKDGDGVGAAEKLKSQQELAEYNLKNDKAYSEIALYIVPDLQIHVSSFHTAKEAWDNLKQNFEFVSVTQIVRNKEILLCENGRRWGFHVATVNILAEMSYSFHSQETR